MIHLLERVTAKLHAGSKQTRPDEAEAEAEWVALVTEVLKLPMRYSPAVHFALVQGRWRTAKNPQAYIRTVAKREMCGTGSRREPKSTLQVPDHIRDEEGEKLQVEEYIDFLCADVGAVRVGGSWKARDPMYEAVFVDDEGREIPCVAGRPVSLDLLMLEDDQPDAKLVINWHEVAKRADLDDDEALVLNLRRLGVTREGMLRPLGKTKKQRRRWQAAWRRLDRQQDRIRAVFLGPQKCLPELSPKLRFGARPQVTATQA